MIVDSGANDADLCETAKTFVNGARGSSHYTHVLSVRGLLCGYDVVAQLQGSSSVLWSNQGE